MTLHQIDVETLHLSSMMFNVSEFIYICAVCMCTFWRTYRAVNISNVLLQWTIICCPMPVDVANDSTDGSSMASSSVNFSRNYPGISVDLWYFANYVASASCTQARTHAMKLCGTWHFVVGQRSGFTCLHTSCTYVRVFPYIGVCARAYVCVSACDSLIIQLVKRNSDFGDPVARLLATVLLTQLVAGQCPTREKLVSFDYFV